MNNQQITEQVNGGSENRFHIGLGDYSFVLKHYLAGYEPGFSEYDNSGLFHKSYSGYNPDKYYSDSKSENQLRDIFQRAKVILDLGSGQGDSIRSVLKFTPNAESIFTVDSNFSNIEIPGKYTHSHLHSDIGPFLQSNDVSADIVIMRGVPTHKLQHSDYEALFRNLSLNGIVFESGDTRLNADEMTNAGFSNLMTVETIVQRGERYYDRIWIKPDIIS